jgi:hypothetical protein
MRENPPALNDPAEVEVQPDVTPAAEERSADEAERAPAIMQCPECGYKGEQADFTPAEGEDEESREGAPEDEAEAEDEEEMVRASDVQRMIAAAAFRAATKAREETLRDLGRLD